MPFALLLLDQVATSERLPSLEAARGSHPDRVGVVQIAPTSERGSEGVQGWILHIMSVWTPSQNWMQFALLLLDQDATSERFPSLEAARRSQPDRVRVVQIAPSSENGSKGSKDGFCASCSRGRSTIYRTCRLLHILKILDWRFRA